MTPDFILSTKLDQMADCVVTLHECKGISLHESCVEVLQGRSLCENKIRRVVERSNRKAFNHWFRKSKDQSIRVVHIPDGPALPDDVIDAVHVSAEGDLDDLLGDLFVRQL